MTMKLNLEQAGTLSGLKRKAADDDIDLRPPKRISPYLNTPKERKEERKRVLKLSIQKLRKMEDPEYFLTRSVLINNTMKRLQKEIRDEKQKHFQGYKNCIYKLRPSYGYDVLNNSYLQSSEDIFEDPFSLNDDSDKVTDQLTRRLVEEGETGPPVIQDSRNDSDLAQHDTTVNVALHKSSSEKQMCSEMDTVLNNLICALGET